MYRPLWLAAGLGALGFMAGIGFAAYADNPASAPALPTAPGLQVVSSSTSLQSFLWIYDPHAQTIVFCYSAAQPATGPQYDFACRSRGVNDAFTP